MILLFGIMCLLACILIVAILSKLKHFCEKKAEKSGMIPEYIVRLVFNLLSLAVIMSCSYIIFVIVMFVKDFP